jgi:hypothetical protein
MKNSLSFAETENSLNFILSLPKQYGKPAGSDFDIDKAKARGLGVMLDIVGAFSPRIICSLQRRMKACQQLLINHIDDIEYNDGMHICWRRKDGKCGEFNIPSYRAMQDAIKALEHSCFKEFCTKKVWIDQTMKALLNDTEQDHTDMGGFRYSQLVSILCELQACPQEYMPK